MTTYSSRNNFNRSNTQLHTEVIDVKNQPGTFVSRTSTFQSCLGSETIATLQSNNRAVIIVAAGTTPEGKRNLQEILHQVWCLPLVGLAAAYAHGSQWIAIVFDTIDAREIGYGKLSEVTFYFEDNPINSITIRRFGGSGPCARADKVAQHPLSDHNSGGKHGLLQALDNIDETPPVAPSHTDSVEENRAATEMTDKKMAPEVERRRHEREQLNKLIPSKFFAHAKGKDGIKSLHAAAQYIASLTNVVPAEDRELPKTKKKAMTSLRKILPGGNIELSPDLPKETGLLVAAAAYISGLGLASARDTAADRLSAERGTASNQSTDMARQRAPGTPAPSSESRKRPSIVDLSSPQPPKSQKRLPGTTASSSKRTRSIYDGAVAIPIPRNPTSASVPQPRANIHAARSNVTTNHAAQQVASPIVTPTTVSDDATVAVLASLDRLDDVVRERRQENVRERELNKFHSTRGANSMVNDARTAIKNQQAKIAKLELELRLLKHKMRTEQEAARHERR